jgi:hypothetical protein
MTPKFQIGDIVRLKGIKTFKFWLRVIGVNYDNHQIQYNYTVHLFETDSPNDYTTKTAEVPEDNLILVPEAVSNVLSL